MEEVVPVGALQLQSRRSATKRRRTPTVRATQLLLLVPPPPQLLLLLLHHLSQLTTTPPIAAEEEGRTRRRSFRHRHSSRVQSIWRLANWPALRPTCRPCPDSRCLTYPVVPISPLCWPPVRTSSSYFLLQTSYFFRTFLISWSFCNNQKCWGNSFFGQTGGVAYDSLDGPFLFHLWHLSARWQHAH